MERDWFWGVPTMKGASRTSRERPRESLRDSKVAMLCSYSHTVIHFSFNEHFLSAFHMHTLWLKSKSQTPTKPTQLPASSNIVFFPLSLTVYSRIIRTTRASWACISLVCLSWQLDSLCGIPFSHLPLRPPVNIYSSTNPRAQTSPPLEIFSNYVLPSENKSLPSWEH